MVVELTRGARGTGGFLSGTVLAELLVVVVGLVVRVRVAVLLVMVDGLAVADLGLVESTKMKEWTILGKKKK